MKSDKPQLIDWFKSLLPAIIVIAMLVHVFFSDNISIYGFLKTFGITSFIFFGIYLINTIGDHPKTTVFWSRHYKGKTKKVIDLFQIIFGVLLFSFFVYYFSFHEDRSFKEFFTFTFSMLGIIFFSLFVAIPVFMSVFSYDEVEWNLKGTWREKFGKIYAIITLILSVILWGGIIYAILNTFHFGGCYAPIC